MITSSRYIVVLYSNCVCPSAINELFLNCFIRSSSIPPPTIPCVCQDLWDWIFPSLPDRCGFWAMSSSANSTLFTISVRTALVSLFPSTNESIQLITFDLLHCPVGCFQSSMIIVRNKSLLNPFAVRSLFVIALIF